MGTLHMRSARPLPPGVEFFPALLRQGGYFCTNHVKTDYNTSTPYESAWDMCSPDADWSHRQAGQPFFAVFEFMESHESRMFVRRPLVTDPLQVRVPAYLPDTPETRADLAQNFDNVGRADEGIGRVLAKLEADGLLDTTIVFYFADHGGATPRSKRFLYDNGTHTPLVVRFPRQFQHLAPARPGSRSAELISYVDLAPTALSLAEVPFPSYFQGRALAGSRRARPPGLIYASRGRMDERYDFSTAVIDGRFRYIRNYYPERPAGQHLDYLWNEASMHRWAELYRSGRLNGPQRAFFEPRSAEELFDCSVDPDNVNNLANDPKYRAVLLRLRGANRTHLLRIRHTGFWPEAMMIAESADGSPARAAASDRYPLERIIDFVDHCQLAGANGAMLEAALSDPAPVLRYWAAVCAINAPQLPDLAGVLQDPDPSVRIAAAEAMLHRQPHPEAWQVMATALRRDQMREIRLAALNSLTYLPKAPAAISERVHGVASEQKPGPVPPPYEPGGEAGAPFTPWHWAELNWRGYSPNAARHLIAEGLA